MRFLQPEQHQQTLTFYLRAAWSLPDANQIKASLRNAAALVHEQRSERVILDAAQAEHLDISALWLLFQQAQRWQQQGVQVEWQNCPDDYLRYCEKAHHALSSRSKPVGWSAVLAPLQRLGRQVHMGGQVAGSALAFLGQGVVAFVMALLRPSHFRFRALFHHVFATGIQAVPIVALIACLMSIVITYQGGAQLRELGASLYTVDMVAISVLRELGVLLTAIIVAGRSGSAFAAEIGLMKTNQEVDALKVMGSDPFMILVLPRMLALLVALPLLTLLANIVALLAAAWISPWLLDISVTQFFARVEYAVEFHTFAAGMIKAPFFAVVIALIGCWQGMQVTGSSESLGEHTTKAVVQSISLVLLLDAVFSILFYQLGM